MGSEDTETQEEMLVPNVLQCITFVNLVTDGVRDSRLPKTMTRNPRRLVGHLLHETNTGRVVLFCRV